MAVIYLDPKWNPWNQLSSSIGSIIADVVMPYFMNKDLINRISDENLTNEKDKITQLLPEAVSQDGNIDWKKVEELAQNNKYAKHILDVRKNRAEFKNANILKKLQLIQNPELIQSAYTININPEAEKRKQKLVNAIQKVAERNPTLKQMIDAYGDVESFIEATGISPQGLLNFSLLQNVLSPQTQEQKHPQKQDEENSSPRVFTTPKQLGLGALANAFPTPQSTLPQMSLLPVLPNLTPRQNQKTKPRQKQKSDNQKQETKQKEIPVIVYPNELPPLPPKTRQQDDKVRIWK